MLFSASAAGTRFAGLRAHTRSLPRGATATRGASRPRTYTARSGSRASLSRSKTNCARRARGGRYGAALGIVRRRLQRTSVGTRRHRHEGHPRHFGRAGGKATSRAKAKAARSNGAKGGRPRVADRNRCLGRQLGGRAAVAEEGIARSKRLAGLPTERTLPITREARSV